MVLQSSGQISLEDLRGEFNYSPGRIDLQDFYSTDEGVPRSGQVTLKDYYGARRSAHFDLGKYTNAPSTYRGWWTEGGWSPSLPTNPPNPATSYGGGFLSYPGNDDTFIQDATSRASTLSATVLGVSEHSVAAPGTPFMRVHLTSPAATPISQTPAIWNNCHIRYPSVREAAGPYTTLTFQPSPNPVQPGSYSSPAGMQDGAKMGWFYPTTGPWVGNHWNSIDNTLPGAPNPTRTMDIWFT